MSKENPNEGLPVMNGVESLYYQEPENYVKRFGTGLINNQWGQTPLILFIINIKPTGWPSLETTLTLRFPAAGLRRYDKLDCFVTTFLARSCPERLMVIGSQGTINAKSPSARAAMPQ